MKEKKAKRLTEKKEEAERLTGQKNEWLNGNEGARKEERLVLSSQGEPLHKHIG